MAQRLLHENADLRVGYPIIGANSVAFAYADPVYIDTSGFLALATTSSKVLGHALDSRTMAATNQTVAAVKPLYTPWEGVVAAITADQAVTQTDIGAYADTGTGTSGAWVLNFAAGTTGQFHCLGFDPEDTATTTLAVIEIAEPQSLGFAQS